MHVSKTNHVKSECEEDISSRSLTKCETFIGHIYLTVSFSAKYLRIPNICITKIYIYSPTFDFVGVSIFFHVLFTLHVVNVYFRLSWIHSVIAGFNALALLMRFSESSQMKGFLW